MTIYNCTFRELNKCSRLSIIRDFSGTKLLEMLNYQAVPFIQSFFLECFMDKKKYKLMLERCKENNP